jgi:hypothetical protein
VTSLRRTPEAQALLNPALGAYLLATATQAAKKAGRLLPWPCAYLVLPFVLSEDIRAELPAKSSHTMSAWLDKHPRHQAVFADRAVALTGYTRMSLRTAVRHRAIEVTVAGLRCPRAPKAAADAPSEEVAACARSAALVGRWLAVVEPATAYTLLGVRP